METTEKQIEALLAGKSKDELLQLDADLGALNAARERDPMAHVVPHTSQKAFLELDKKEAFLFGANSAGKSFIGAYRAACYLTGNDPLGLLPYKIPPVSRIFGGIRIKTKGWLGAVKLEKGVEIIRQNLLPLLPPGSVKTFKEYSGYLEMVNGATLQVMSYDAETEKWQSDALDFIWYDEQPHWDHYNEGRARVARRDGRTWVTVTPVYVHSVWMYWEVFKNRNSNPDVGYVEADIEDNFYLTDVMKERLYNAYGGTDEADARLHGKFIFSQNAIHGGFNHSIHKIKPFPIDEGKKAEYEFARVFDLHPRSPNVCSFIMFKKRPSIVYVIDELDMQGVHIGVFADAVNERTRQLGITVKLNIIDTPDPVSATQPGTTLRLELAKKGIAGLPANRSIELGVERMNEYLNREKIFIFDTCKNHIFSIENYMWDNWRGVTGEDRNPKEKPKTKDDHWVRNLHFFLIYMPTLDENRTHLDLNQKYKYNSPRYLLNLQKRVKGEH